MATSRRRFLGTAAAVAASAWVAPIGADDAKAKRSANGRLGVGSIGLRYQGSVVTNEFRPHADVVALCDVDRHVREQARAAFGSTPRIFEDYRELLDREDVDAVVIGTPDHWHTKMLADAVRAGKHAYCEKPLTLTVDEGKFLRDVVRDSGQVVQVGTWQRSDERFRLAAEMVRAGRVGTLRKVTCATSPNPTGGPFEPRPVPAHFNWDLWQGQTPDVPYVPERGHYTFRWWYEYSGGKMTDWGAHHIDIAQWAIGEYPAKVETRSKLPAAGDRSYNVAERFFARFTYPSSVVMEVSDEGRNGILFEGDAGRLFVSRGNLTGRPVEDLPNNPLPRSDFTLYDFDNLDRPPRSGKIDAIQNHVDNFLDCVAAGRTPVSDVESQHRSVTTCHIAGIAMRLGDRPLTWDAESETFTGDAEANAMLSREQREGFEVV